MPQTNFAALGGNVHLHLLCRLFLPPGAAFFKTMTLECIECGAEAVAVFKGNSGCGKHLSEWKAHQEACDTLQSKADATMERAYDAIEKAQKRVFETI